MTLQNLRALARRTLGAGAASRLTTRQSLVRALATRAEPASGPSTPRAAAKAVAAGAVTKRTARRPPAAKPGARRVEKKPAARKPARSVAKPSKAGKPEQPAKPATPRRPAKQPARLAKPEPAKDAPARARKPQRSPDPRPPRARAAPRPRRTRSGNGEGATDPAGFFVARVRGEEAVRGAPHPMLESARPPPVARRAPRPGAVEDEDAAPRGSALGPRDEELGELPASYGEDTLVLLPRDPTSLFAFWDQSDETMRQAFRDLARPRAQLWLWARAGEGWERVRVVDLALESRAWYLHGLEPGRSYRAELRAVDGGRERAIGPGSGEVELPRAGPSPIVEDRFVRLPWDQPLGPPLGPGHPGPELPFEARQALAELSTWVGEALQSSSGPTPPADEGERR